MAANFGEDWPRQRLPSGMFDSWMEKRNHAVKAGQPGLPLIEYADFTDYKAIIERKDSWREVFQQIFQRAEDVRESFQRLFPLRISTMHSRIITTDDELLLLVESRRLLKAVGR
jgi:hypothetical protein